MTHGTAYGYKSGCRCKECRARHAAMAATWRRSNQSRIAAQSKRRRVRRATEGFDERPHGSLTTYSYGCRCEPCRVVNNAYQRDRRAARKAAERGAA